MKSVSQTFREAADILWDGTSNFYKRNETFFCCRAIRNVIKGNESTCLKIIRQRLGNYLTVRSWLLYTHKINPAANDMQAYRKRWMLALADEFEGENK